MQVKLIHFYSTNLSLLHHQTECKETVLWRVFHFLFYTVRQTNNSHGLWLKIWKKYIQEGVNMYQNYCL